MMPVRAAMLCAATGLTCSAQAQCPAADWLYSPLQGYPGINGTVSTVDTWDPDGGGPQPPRLIAGGSFTVAGSALAKNVAMWDGATWQALGTGLPGTVHSITTHNGSLVVGGLLAAPYNGVAMWDGSAWQPLASGIIPSGGPTDVKALTTFDNDLYAAGSFIGTGIEAINGSIARWDGTGWHDVGGGVAGLGARIETLQVYGSNLVVGGSFSTAGGLTVGHIAQWNGTVWSKVGIYGVTTGSEVGTLAVYNGLLFASGSFSAVDAIGPMGNLATWNGTTWAQVNGGSTPISATARSSTVLNGLLYLFGGSALHTWNGTSFSTFTAPPSSSPNALAAYDGQLILGSASSRYAIARRDGTTWRTLGNGMLRHGANVTDPRPAVAYNSGVAIASNNFSPTDTSVMVSGVAYWDGGSNLTRLGTTEWGNGVSPRALMVFNNQLISAGQENFAIGGCVSALNGNVWQGMGTGSWGSGRVSALTTFKGQLVAGGSFTTAAGTPANRVARWTGSSWQPFGSGIGVGFGGNEVRALAVYNNQLYASGDFSSQGSLARWNGTSWQPVSVGINNTGYALAVYNNRLYVGGTFTLAGGNQAHGMAYWDGTTLTPDLGGSIATYSLLSAFGHLYAGGLFHFAGPGVADNIARFDGTAWGPLGNGIGAVPDLFENFPAVRGLAAYQSQVIAAGDFLAAGNAVSTSWARYGCPTIGACYANCDGSSSFPALTANDFQCFLNKFAAADPYANCDASTGSPTLTANDFQCFLNSFAAGCS